MSTYLSADARCPWSSDILDRKHVTNGLGHLAAAIKQEMLDVKPKSRKGLSGGTLGLCDLVFVVRKDEVDATSVDINRRPRPAVAAPSLSTRCASPDDRDQHRSPRRALPVAGDFHSTKSRASCLAY